MRSWFSFLQRYYLWAALLLPLAAQAQEPARFRTTWYDTARTQRRAVYGVQLRGPHPDTVVHGPFRRFARNGALEELGHFTDGQPDSIWTRYYAPAPGRAMAVARRLPMRAGQPDGPFVVFHPDGRVAQRGTFRQGQLVDSLVTTGKTGRPRMLARFDSSRVPGLRGTFRQWGGRYTSDFLAAIYYWGDGTSGNNAYPRRDTARYWRGQLAAGRLVGAYTEYDPDGEPRVRLSYTAQGQYRLASLYYPAVWLRNEQGRDQPIPADSVVHSRPMLEWQAVGRRPYLLQRYWSFHDGLTDNIAQTQLFQLAPYRGARRTFISDVVGVLDRPTVAQLPPLVARSTLQSPECRSLYARAAARRRPALPKSGSELAYQRLRHLPPISLRKLRSPGRWRLGEADTTGAVHRPARRREMTLPDRYRVVETPFSSRIYSPRGQLVELNHWRFGGRKIERRYYENGQPESVTRKGWLASYSRSWNAAGRRISNDLNRLVGVRMVKVRRRVTRHGKFEMRTRIQPRFRKARGNVHFR